MKTYITILIVTLAALVRLSAAIPLGVGSVQQINRMATSCDIIAQGTLRLDDDSMRIVMEGRPDQSITTVKFLLTTDKFQTNRKDLSLAEAVTSVLQKYSKSGPSTANSVYDLYLISPDRYPNGIKVTYFANFSEKSQMEIIFICPVDEFNGNDVSQILRITPAADFQVLRDVIVNGKSSLATQYAIITMMESKPSDQQINELADIVKAQKEPKLIRAWLLGTSARLSQLGENNEANTSATVSIINTAISVIQTTQTDNESSGNMWRLLQQIVNGSIKDQALRNSALRRLEQVRPTNSNVPTRRVLTNTSP